MVSVAAATQCLWLSPLCFADFIVFLWIFSLLQTGKLRNSQLTYPRSILDVVMLGHIDMLSAHDVTLLGCGMVKTPFLTSFSVECCHSNAIFTPLLSLRRKFLAETGSKPEVPGKPIYKLPEKDSYCLSSCPCSSVQ